MEIPPGVGALPLHDGWRVFLHGDFIDAEVDAAEVHAVHREGCGRREQYKHFEPVLVCCGFFLTIR